MTCQVDDEHENSNAASYEESRIISDNNSFIMLNQCTSLSAILPMQCGYYCH